MDSSSARTAESSESSKKRRRPPPLQRSLAVILASLQGEQVKIELKSDKIVQGTVEEAHVGMNLQLSDVDYDDNKLDMFYLQGDSIRLIHIPAHINVTDHMSQYMKRVERHGPKRVKISDTRKKDV